MSNQSITTLPREYPIHSAEVVKSNHIIWYGSYDKDNIGAVEAKLINYVISTINPRRDKELKTFKADYADLRNILNVNNYDFIDKAITTLNGTYLKFSKTVEGEWDKTSTYNLFSVCDIYKNKKTDKRYVEMKLSGELKNLFLELKGNFTIYNYKFISGMRSIGLINFYELLKSYEYNGLAIITIDMIRKKLGLKKSVPYKEVKRKVKNYISKLEKTDIKVTLLEEIKERNKSTSRMCVTKIKLAIGKGVSIADAGLIQYLEINPNAILTIKDQLNIEDQEFLELDEKGRILYLGSKFKNDRQFRNLVISEYQRKLAG